MVDRQAYDPSTIQKPIKLSATWFVAILILDATLLTGAAMISHPEWAAGLLVAAAIGFPLLACVAVFLLQTAFRGQQLADEPFLEWSKQRAELFRGFKPEAVSAPPGTVHLHLEGMAVDKPLEALEAPPGKAQRRRQRLRRPVKGSTSGTTISS